MEARIQELKIRLQACENNAKGNALGKGFNSVSGATIKVAMEWIHPMHRNIQKSATSNKQPVT
jgi:hypothetical protein